MLQVRHRQTRSNGRTISWTSPVLAILSLLLALAIALGHHFFYAFWNDKAVANDTQQQWIIRIGTAFAFLVNSLMVVPISYAFVQQVWLSLQRKPIKVSEIDTLFSVLGNIFELFKLKVWIRRPLLAITAMAVWAVPIGSILPPGTLTVSYSQRTASQSIGVAEYDFTKYLNYMPGYSTNAGGVPQLSNAGSELSRLFLASSSSTAILQQTAPKPNSTFTLDTFAPALTCEPSAQVYTAFSQFLLEVGGNAGVQSGSVLFFSWVPGSSNATDFPAIDSTTFATLDISTNATSQIYLWANSPDILGGLQQQTQPGLIVCSLKNASYTLAFNFTNTQQNLTILNRNVLNDVSGFKIVNKLYFGQSQTLQEQNVAYVALMDAFGRILTGSVSGEANHLSGNNYESTSTLVLSTALSNSSLPWTNDTFASSVEEMFQNATFSLLSSANFLTDSSATIPQNVTVLENQNIYVYKPSSLLISYGVVVAVGAIATVIGIVVTLRNGLTFNQSFSTFLRTTRNPRLDEIMYAEDMNGAEPCDERVKKGEFIYRPISTQGMVPGFSPVQLAELRNTPARVSAMGKNASASTTTGHSNGYGEGVELNRLRSLYGNTPSYARLSEEDHEGEHARV